MKIFALHTGTSIFSSTFYSTKELARKALKKNRDEITLNHNIHITCDTQDRFQFYFGWAEDGATWKVSEIDVKEKE